MDSKSESNMEVKKVSDFGVENDDRTSLCSISSNDESYSEGMEVMARIQFDNLDVLDTEGGNIYLANKSVAQGMMDIALLTANANQLKFVLQFYRENSIQFIIMVILILLSIVIQIIIGIMLIFKGKTDYEGETDKEKEEAKKEHSIKMNNIIVVFVFLVTVINVFIAAFSVDNTSTPTQATSSLSMSAS